MTDYQLKIGSYLSSITDYLGYNGLASSDDSDSTGSSDDLSLEDLLHDRVGVDQRKQKAESNQDASSDSTESPQQPDDVQENEALLPRSDSEESGTKLIASPSTFELTPVSDRGHLLHVDGQSVEEILEIRLSSLDVMPTPANQVLERRSSLEHKLSLKQEPEDTEVVCTTYSHEAKTTSCLACTTVTSGENVCIFCKRKTVHFHEELNITHTISIESGNFLTPLPKKESSKTDL